MEIFCLLLQNSFIPPLQLWPYVDELADAETHRTFVMVQKFGTWIPIRSDLSQPSAQEVILQHDGAQQTIYLVLLSHRINFLPIFAGMQAP